jgi:hypothetical protein
MTDEVARPTEAPREPDEPEWLRLDRRRALHAFDWGALAALVVAVIYGVLWGAVQLYLGLIAVAVMGGWLIGAGVRRGAWRSGQHLPDVRLRLLSAGLALAAWLGGAFVAWVSSRALLPQSTLDLAERLAELGFTEYFVQVYDIVHGAAAAVMVFMAWRTAR